MSRHRFVKNLDLDAEMEEEEEEEEEEDGMTAEQKAQLATSMPIARALLKDVKPPISDNAIADSLWHYWFDVDKAVAWLRKDWEKKGEATIPTDLEPTPDQQPRRKGAKRQRMTSPEIPLSALQRLSLARKTSPPNPTSEPSVPSLTVSTPEGGKPKSKLALLAEQRRLASSKASPSQSPAASSPTPSTSQLPADASPSKPLSKLAQKMAAARAAKADGSAKPTSSKNGETPHMSAVNGAEEEVEIDEVDTTLFPSSTPKASNQSTTSPSAFFNVLTSTHRKPLLPTSELSMHLPAVGDANELQRRIRTAFGEGVESPDDIVLRARSGRGGIAAPASATATT